MASLLKSCRDEVNDLKQFAVFLANAPTAGIDEPLKEKLSELYRDVAKELGFSTARLAHLENLRKLSASEAKHSETLGRKIH